MAPWCIVLRYISLNINEIKRHFVCLRVIFFSLWTLCSYLFLIVLSGFLFFSQFLVALYILRENLSLSMIIVTSFFLSLLFVLRFSYGVSPHTLNMFKFLILCILICQPFLLWLLDFILYLGRPSLVEDNKKIHPCFYIIFYMFFFYIL